MDVPIGSVRGGWMNRLLGALPGAEAETAFAIGREVPLILSGAAPISSWSPSTRLDLTPQARLLLELLYANDPLFHAASSDALDLAFGRFTEGDGVNRMMQLDLVTQMPDDLLMLTDKMSMAASLECRVPLLDERLVNLAMSMPGEQKIRGRELKSIMKRALEPMLPKNILYRKKRGFGAPMGAWFKNELKPMMEHLLSTEVIQKRGLFKPSIVATMIEEHGSNQADRTDELMALINLEIWSRMYLDGRSHSDVNGELKQVM